MVKFAKQLEEQLVPEWKDAFLDYWQLKKELRKIRILNCSTRNNNNSLQENKTIYFKTIRKIFQFEQKQRQHTPIRVHRKPATLACSSELYKTELLEELTGVEAATEFFALLDQQLNKVNHFYETKETEFLERGESLKQQLEILVQLKQRTQKGAQSDDDPSVSCEKEEKEMQPTEDSSISKGLSGRVFSCRGKSIRLNIPLTNPSQTISAIAYLLREDVMKESNKCSSSGNKIHLNKTKLLHAEKMIRNAFIELFKGLNYLQTYRSLNKLALVKVLEKFDKVTNKGVLPIYLKLVDSSYFNISDKVMRLSDEIEDLFVKHFTKGDHNMAMKYLKPTHRKESHALTFFTGLFTGCLVALLVGYVIMAHIAGMYTQRSDTVYMETVYPVLSIFGLLFLHLFLYGCNIFMWRKTRINYGFIFELAPTKELKFREVFFICSTSMASIIGVLFIHLSLLDKGYTSTQVQAIPGILLLCFLLLLICPFNILYKSSRYRFLFVIRNIALSPLYKVVMLDFFMADQLCSQVPLLRNLEYVACYYITGSYKTQDYGYCSRRADYRDLAYAVSFLPYYWRAMQCARRWFDEGQCSHLVNLGKYVSAMLAAGAKLAYEKETSVGYLCLVVALSSAATVYQLYWDYVKDWGLLQGNSKNLWLRTELMIRNKFIYYFSMVLNLVLRLAWLQTVLHPSFGNVDDRVMGLFLAALEVIRRGQWNFYRLENEHLNNAGKFRAVRTVPLPFHEMEDED